MWVLISSITILILALYFLLVGRFKNGWKQNPVFLAEDNCSLAKNISVIIACRNEDANLPKLISALRDQTASDFQVIFIDDHSSDNTKTIIESELAYQKNWNLLKAKGFGKKNALKEAIKLAIGELIITTDADCIPNRKWIATINEFQHKNQCELIICPVTMDEGNSVFTNLQSIEFISLIASGAGAAGSNKPIMCNAANLAFSKEAWLASSNEMQENELSGDDMFLLQSIKKRNGKIAFLKSKAAMISTRAVETLPALIKQRQRWTSKSRLYKDFDVIYTALVVFSITFTQIALLIIACFDIKYWIVFTTLFLAKLVIDISLLKKVEGFFELKNTVRKSFLLSLIYPLYITFTSISGLLKRTKTW